MGREGREAIRCSTRKKLICFRNIFQSKKDPREWSRASVWQECERMTVESEKESVERGRFEKLRTRFLSMIFMRGV